MSDTVSTPALTSTPTTPPVPAQTVVEKAKDFACAAHAATNHLFDKDKPYSFHLSMVVSFATRFAILLPEGDRETALAAAWAHDTIEDTRSTYNDVKKALGEKVADVVYAVTNEKGKTRKERANDKYYEGIRASRVATFVKICDRLANAFYSTTKGGTMSGVYRTEYTDFKKALFTEEFAPMWRQLDAMLGNVYSKTGDTIHAVIMGAYMASPALVADAVTQLMNLRPEPDHTNAFAATIAALMKNDTLWDALKRAREEQIPTPPPVVEPVVPAPVVPVPVTEMSPEELAAIAPVREAFQVIESAITPVVPELPAPIAPTSFQAIESSITVITDFEAPCTPVIPVRDPYETCVGIIPPEVKS